MAFFDDPRFLLSHIDHSFITGDDTGSCEMIMLDQRVFTPTASTIGNQQHNNIEHLPDYELEYETELSEQRQSYDITQGYISHRRRSNTAQRLEKIRKEKIDRSKTKTIFWQRKAPQQSIDDHDLLTTSNHDEQGKRREPRTPPIRSRLSQLLDKYPSIPKNPFDEFAQFDGHVLEASSVKRFKIVIALNNSSSDAQSQQQDMPNAQNQSQSKRYMDIAIASNAKIHDLIGLICWQYSNEGLEPSLEPDVSRYCLYIVEDNGEIDPDFPSLNPREPVVKFGFSTLALTKKSLSCGASNTNLIIHNQHLHNAPVPCIVHVVNGASQTKSHKIGRKKFPNIRRILFKDADLDSHIRSNK